ncbi:MAG: leucine-rich repeat protein [Eggerthellaceae bacterium]|nr:leucine-rich repeat protein [Eggerthellaceae bacterium]
MLKKLISSVTALTLITGMCPSLAFAAMNDESTSEYTYEISGEDEGDAAPAASQESNGDHQSTVNSSDVVPLEVASGTCGEEGDNATWTLGEDGVLTISGTGDMADYPSASQIPWYTYRSSIVSVVINEGITSVGDGAFYKCSEIADVSLPSTVTYIGEKAFSNCSALTSIDFPTGLTYIGSYAFQQCGLTSVIIPTGVTSISDKAFYFNASLTEVILPNTITNIGTMAFGTCTSLYTIMFPVQLFDSLVTVSGTAFNGDTNIEVIYTNADSVDAFWNAADASVYQAAYAPLFTNRYTSLEVFPHLEEIPTLDEELAALKALVEQAQSAYPESSSANYTASTWSAFYGSLQSASDLLDAENPTLISIVEAYFSLDYYMHSLIDISGLKDLIDQANSLDEEAYTEESWEMLTNSLGIANTVYTDPDSTQEWVTFAEYMLDASLSALIEAGQEVEPADKSALTEAISKYQALTSTDYTSDTWQEMEWTLLYAQYVLDDDDATQELVDDAVIFLDLAYSNLVANTPEGTVNKTALSNLIAEAQKLTESDYTASSWNVLESALANAQAVYADDNATQSDVNAAYQILVAAITGLESSEETQTVNKTALIYTILIAMSLDESSYTSSSWQNLESALDDAITVYSEYSATQNDIDTAVTTLGNALTSLVEVSTTPNPELDKSALEEAIALAETLTSDGYNPYSWQAMQEVLTAAKVIYGQSNPSQAAINEAAYALNAAIDSLTPAYSDVPSKTDENSWYYDAVYDLTESGILTGYGPDYTIFGVGDPMTRADFVTVLWRIAEPEEYANYDESTAVNTSTFTDVPDYTYYTGAVNWAENAGIITGYSSDGSQIFDPDGDMYFDQMVTMVARLAVGYDTAESWDTSILESSLFTDGDEVASWAAGPMSWAIDEGVVTGNENDNGTFTLSPDSYVARERVVTVLWKALVNGLIDNM